MGQRPFWLRELGPTFDVAAHVQPPNTVEALALWFGFSPDELALNQEGQLSVRQKQTVRFQGVRIIIVGSVLILLDMLLAAAIAPTVPPSERPALVALLVLIVALMVIVGRASTEILKPRVHLIEGPLHATGTARNPRLRVENHILIVSYRRWLRWKGLDRPERQRYRIYYAGRTLLSVEPWNGP
ncbi:MAG TPA: hypothetical protein PKD09_24775 [Aggregatilinea sp.]|nr:hypothetical protein [Aggregatilinea sp.]